jgi:hypothetical protein
VCAIDEGAADECVPLESVCCGEYVLLVNVLLVRVLLVSVCC